MNEAHNAVITDGEIESNEHPIGKKVHLSTVTHAWRGKLAAVTASYYILDNAEPVALVDSTGPIGEYAREMNNVRDGDEIQPGGTTVRVLRSAVAWLLSAP